MSFARFALRTAALHALRDRTLVGDNVRDSDIGAIDIGADGAIRTDEDRPFILIYTDDSTAEDTALRDLYQNGTLDFVCEFGISTAMTVTNPATGESVTGSGVPGTDAAFEMELDIIDRQIVAALTGDGPWADIWRALSDKVLRIERRRAASAEDGARMAARQMRVRLEMKPDPVWGAPLQPASVWRRFMDALATADAELHVVALGFLGSQGTALTVEMIRASRGHTLAERDALGYGPQHPGGEAWTIDTVVLEEEIGG